MLAAVLVVGFACAAPPKTIASLQSPTPSPSPTPTAPLQASGPGFHVGEVGVGYAPVALSATGGVAPYRWTVSAGSLPAGLTVGPDGSVSGNPTGAGSYAFTIQVADAGDSTATINGTIGIAAPVTATLLPACAQYCNVELGCVTVCGNFGTLSGRVAPYSYALTQGPLPAGTSLSALSLTGTFVGLSGYLKFSVQVTDGLGATSSISPTFWMYQHISLSNAVCYGNFGTGCTVQIPISGGVPGGTPSVSLLANATYNPPNASKCWPATPAAPQAGWLTVSGSNVVVSIPKSYMSGYGAVWTVQLTDHTYCAQSTYCTSNQAAVTIGVQCG
ncbi:MAG TPA: putative Ig domain-containing protein [Candidatus Sulfotelmatobacter sp.]|nr:putative Ig domain-containing protein [Candidatus Sulfotelmatobacter sp.]